MENEEQLFATQSACLGGIEGDFTSEGGVPSPGDLRCSPQNCDCLSTEVIQLSPCLLFSEPI